MVNAILVGIEEGHSEEYFSSECIETGGEHAD
jgi:hypothetical protein